jgi:Tfp pilus assembly protein PilN
MPSVNMIAPRRADKRRRERDMRRLVVVIIAELIFAVGLGGWVCTRVLSTSNRIADLNTEISKLKPIVKQIEDYDKAKARLDPKLNLLNQAKDCTLRWYGALDRLTQSMPDSTYLVRINTTADDKDKSAPISVSMNGISVSQERVGETMMRLQSIPEFETVKLHHTQDSAASGAPAVEFQIDAAMKGSQPAKGAKRNASAES